MAVTDIELASWKKQMQTKWQDVQEKLKTRFEVLMEEEIHKKNSLMQQEQRNLRINTMNLDGKDSTNYNTQNGENNIDTFVEELELIADGRFTTKLDDVGEVTSFPHEKSFPAIWCDHNGSLMKVLRESDEQPDAQALTLQRWTRELDSWTEDTITVRHLLGYRPDNVIIRPTGRDHGVLWIPLTHTYYNSTKLLVFNTTSAQVETSSDIGMHLSPPNFDISTAMLWCGVPDEHRVLLLEFPSLTEHSSLNFPSTVRPLELALSDSRVAIWSSPDQRIHVFNRAGTALKQLVFTVRSDAKRGIAISEDNKLLASSARDSAFRVWDEHGELLTKLSNIKRVDPAHKCYCQNVIHHDKHVYLEDCQVAKPMREIYRAVSLIHAGKCKCDMDGHSPSVIKSGYGF